MSFFCSDLRFVSFTACILQTLFYFYVHFLVQDANDMKVKLQKYEIEFEKAKTSSETKLLQLSKIDCGINMDDMYAIQFSLLILLNDVLLFSLPSFFCVVYF